jgi:hypothetical protein
VNPIQYAQMVSSFSAITHGVGESGRCCEKVRHGIPECCYQVVDGAELTFTEEEVRVIGVPMVLRKLDGVFVLDRTWWDAERLADSMHNGMLSRTLECASHPTRPVVRDGLVVDVVVINGCNADLMLEKYRRHSDILLSLWQAAVMNLGMKPYYGHPGMLKDDWRSIL